MDTKDGRSSGGTGAPQRLHGGIEGARYGSYQFLIASRCQICSEPLLFFRVLHKLISFSCSVGYSFSHPPLSTDFRPERGAYIYSALL